MVGYLGHLAQIIKSSGHGSPGRGPYTEDTSHPRREVRLHINTVFIFSDGRHTSTSSIHRDLIDCRDKKAASEFDLVVTTERAEPDGFQSEQAPLVVETLLEVDFAYFVPLLDTLLQNPVGDISDDRCVIAPDGGYYLHKFVAEGRCESDGLDAIGLASFTRQTTTWGFLTLGEHRLLNIVLPLRVGSDIVLQQTASYT